MNDNIMKGERKIARKLREWYPGAIYHLMHRGVRRTEIFSDETDYQVFLEILKVALEILLDKVGMYDNRTKKAYRCIWKCWEKETNEPIELALQWLKKNLSNEDFLKVYSWGRSNHKISGKESCK